MRQNWLSIPVFETYEAILDAGWNARNRLIAPPDIITSLSLQWAHSGQ